MTTTPAALGVTLRDGGADVAVHAPDAEAVEVCLYDAAGAAETARFRLDGRIGGLHHGFVPGIAAGTRYGLRAHGPWAPEAGLRFNPAKLLVDPWATRLDRPFRLHDALFDRRAAGSARDDVDSAAAVPKAIVEAPAAAPTDGRPPIVWRDLVVYELSVRGFTMRHPDVPPAIRGTFAGLGHPAAVAHLAGLGVTAVELMPIAAWIDERHLPPLGLANAWGYNPIAWMAPDPRLAPGGWDEVRAAVAALQAAGIAVLIDVVLNHSGESDRYGPTVSLRGLDNAGYYRLVPGAAADYVNDAGCGNILALDRPAGLRLAMDALRTCALRGGFDGFRYDLATTLARRPDGFDPDAPLLAAIAQDPVLNRLVHIAEPWDVGPGGHRLGGFPAGWGEWNDRWRDAVRRFWRGDPGRVGELATRFAGSADVFAPRRRPVSRSINFVTAHDGFTLADLVAHERKHNEANGEQNRDGTDDNASWNNGVEGPSDDPAVRARRAADMRALLATLLFSRGTPMLSMGDEAGRGQGGNNNAYAQDNALAWFDWDGADRDLVAFAARLVALRRAHPALSAERPLSGAPVEAGGLPDVEWLTAEGRPMGEADWHDAGRRLLVAALHAPADGERPESRVLVALNAARDAVVLTLPHPRDGRAWRRALDSADPAAGPAPLGATLAVPARAVVLAVEEAAGADRARRPSGVDPAVLDRLARAAGIAPDWWDIDGRHHRVSDDTKRALLAALRLPADSTAQARDGLARLVVERDRRDLPHALTTVEGAPARLPLGPGLAGRVVALRLETEAGAATTLLLGPDDGDLSTASAADGSPLVRRLVPLPPLPAGRHVVRLDHRPEVACRLMVAPARCHWPADLAAGARRFGLAAHLYAVRSAEDCGIGDFGTLAALARAAAAHGAVTIGLNPLHALFEHDRERASPYAPSDRRFLDPIHLDVGALPAELVGEAVRRALDAEAGAFAHLRAAPAVDYPAVWAAKRRVLDAAFDTFERLPEGAPLAVAFDAFRRSGGETLERFARHGAIVAATGLSDWRDWPVELARPDAPAVAALAGRHATAIRRTVFEQFLADRQFAGAAAAARGAGLALGFYRDLAVGCAPDGAEAWAERDGLMRGVSIGAPPDPFAADGQVWNLPAPDPLAAARDGFTGFARLVAANMAHAGALRIDHVLGLRRLFLVPDGARGADGAYLAQPFDDLLGQVALESRRAATLVVGEDLGTVPDGFRERLDAAGLFSYRVLWFEREGPGFRPASAWPAHAAACVSTHDLATLAGWWSEADIDEDRALDRLGEDAAAAARARRAEERRALLAALAAAGIAVADDAADHAAGGPMTPELAAAVHAFVAGAPSALMLVQADDLAGETVAVNLPGTDRERPNWRRRVAVPAETLLDTPVARAVLARLGPRGAD